MIDVPHEGELKFVEEGYLDEQQMRDHLTLVFAAMTDNDLMAAFCACILPLGLMRVSQRPLKRTKALLEHALVVFKNVLLLEVQRREHKKVGKLQ